jgi:hypothetical protein
MKSLIAILLVAGIMMSGCASINSVSLTPIPTQRKTSVRTEKSKIIFLGFNFDNDFVDDAVEDLKTQCPNGQVTGLLTKDETVLYFLFIVWKKKITATGYCVAMEKNKKRDTASFETSGL